MKYSIIVPVYNTEEYLKQCIQSVLEQSYSDYELVLIDDGSTDSSGWICDLYSDYTNVVVKHKKNEGLISARREGLHLSSGDYILFCDSDDYLDPSALQRIEETINSTSADIVLFNMLVLSNPAQPMTEHLFENLSVVDKKDILSKLFTSYEFNSLCSKACKRKLYDIETDYSEFYPFNYGEDLLQSAPLYIAASKIVYLDEKLYNYRYTSGMMRKFSDKYYDSYVRNGKKVLDLLENIGVKDSEKKYQIYVLNSAYGQIMLCRNAREKLSEVVEKLNRDKEFCTAYERIIRFDHARGMENKKKVVLKSLRNNRQKILRFIFNLAEFKDKVRTSHGKDK